MTRYSVLEPIQGAGLDNVLGTEKELRNFETTSDYFIEKTGVHSPLSLYATETLHSNANIFQVKPSQVSKTLSN